MISTRIAVKMKPELRELLDAIAGNRPLGDICTELLATHPRINRPDLAEVPRNPLGRPRAEHRGVTSRAS